MDSISENTSVHASAVTDDDGSHGDSHQVEEDQSVRVVCVASGTGRVPEVRVTLGPRIDITSSFNRIQTERRAGPRGLEIVHYEVRLVRDWLQLTADDDGKHIRCTARVHGYQDLTRKVTKTLEVRCKYLVIHFTCVDEMRQPTIIFVTFQKCEGSCDMPSRVHCIARECSTQFALCMRCNKTNCISETFSSEVRNKNATSAAAHQ